MSKIIYAFYRNKVDKSIKNKLFKICENIAPDNIRPRSPLVHISNHFAYAVMNPTKTISIHEGSVLLGKTYCEMENWYNPGEKYPDGSYALFRINDDKCEIVSDIVASRTIWYYKDEEKLLASTSQRAIIMFLNKFEFDERVIPWMLSAGTLGPSYSWDKRLQRLLPNSSIILHRNDWSIKAKSELIDFNKITLSDEESEKIFREKLDETFLNLKMDFARWVLPLSGGYDSRGILCLLLKNNDTSKENLKTVTWGSNSTQSVKGSEGYIADKLSKKLDISNKYYNIDFSGERIDKVLDRFIRFGEGRVDHFSAYTDGFKMWQDLYDAGIEGIIRGDMAFGGPNINSALSIRYALEYSVCSDFSNLKNYKNYGFAKQVLPEYLEQKKHESLDKWHARVYLQYRMPIVQSALADLKLSYVEQINPLLSKELFKFGRVSLPDHLWVDKKLWKKVVDSLSPKVNIAKIDSIPSINDIFKNEDFISVIKKELNSEMAKNLLPKEFLKFVLKGIEKNNKKVIFNTKPLIRIIKGLIPQALKEAILDNIKKPNVNSNKLAFRTFIIIRTNKILHEDSLIIN